MADAATDRVPLQPVRDADRDRVVPMLARAFRDDPCFAWVFRSSPDRIADLEILFDGAFADLARHGISWITDDGAGASLWAPPGRTWDDEAMAPMIERMTATYRPDDFERLGAFFGLTAAAHPTEPHYYLGVLAADEGRQGEGLGSACLRQGLVAVDAEGAAAYLESSNAKNVPLYERFGFEVTSTVDLPDGGPPIFLMWRPAQPGRPRT